MNTHFISMPLWSTASYGHKAETSALELSTLGEHLALCRGSHAHMFALHCAARAMHGFVVTRFVTTVVLVALLIAVSFMVL